jgi:ankyrin repeat protein
MLLTRPELNINVVDNKNQSHVLHLVDDNVDIVKTLLKRKDISIDAKDKDGTTPLGLATAHDYHAVALLFINAGADPSQVWEGRIKIGEYGKTRKKCKKKHRLIMWNTLNGLFDCKMCGDKQPVGSVLYGCDECEWDMCSACEF